MKFRALIAASLFWICLASTSQADLIITGVVDGNESGGTPKGAELFSLADIADLSAFSIQRFTNGAASATSLTTLPSISLNAGDFFYITGGTSSNDFFTDNGFTVGLTGTVANINGDDLLQIVRTSDAEVVDTFGLPGQGDTNFYQDSIAYRLSTSFSPNPNGLVDASNFSITPWVDSADFGARFGTYTAIPEPSTYGVLTIVGLAGLAYRRRRCMPRKAKFKSVHNELR